jgi:multisubunit Na+/H+ antiporter MnhF subunit
MAGKNLPAPYESKAEDSGTADRNAVPSQSASDYRKCPFCKERIYHDAIKCKHCGSVLAPIADNFPNITGAAGFGNNVQIVTNAQPIEAPRKPSDYIVAPPPNSNSMLGHGWSVLVVSIVFAAVVGGSVGDEAVGAATLGAAIVAPWAIWLLSKASANKVLPAIALIIATLMFVGVVTP